MGIDRKHQPQTYANHSTPLLNIIHISPFSTLVGMTALSRNEMTFAPPEKRLQKRLCLRIMLMFDDQFINGTLGAQEGCCDALCIDFIACDKDCNFLQRQHE